MLVAQQLAAKSLKFRDAFRERSDALSQRGSMSSRHSIASGFRIEEFPIFEIALLGARIERVGSAYNVYGASKCLFEGNTKASKREKRE